MHRCGLWKVKETGWDNGWDQLSQRQGQVASSYKYSNELPRFLQSGEFLD